MKKTFNKLNNTITFVFDQQTNGRGAVWPLPIGLWPRSRYWEEIAPLPRVQQHHGGPPSLWPRSIPRPCPCPSVLIFFLLDRETGRESEEPGRNDWEGTWAGKREGGRGVVGWVVVVAFGGYWGAKRSRRYWEPIDQRVVECVMDEFCWTDWDDPRKMMGAWMMRLEMLKDANGEPAVDQGQLNGWWISWNPDDGRWYVSERDDGVASATFGEMRNARRWARTHG